jgi:hypothetical protein
MTTIPKDRYKQGHVRDSDGRIFYKYQKRKMADGSIKIYEKWLSPVAFERQKQTQWTRMLDPKNRQKNKDRCKKHYYQNREEISNKYKLWRKNPENRKKEKARSIEYYQKNKETINAKNREYYYRNWKKLRECVKKRDKERRLSDPEYALRVKLRSRIRISIKKAGSEKSNGTKELIGCSYAFLRKHLESQFRDGMAWDKPHSFHIDHIRPLSSFDLTDPDQQKAACHWTNLQPLTPKENWRKGARFPLQD